MFSVLIDCEDVLVSEQEDRSWEAGICFSMLALPADWYSVRGVPFETVVAEEWSMAHHCDDSTKEREREREGGGSGSKKERGTGVAVG